MSVQAVTSTSEGLVSPNTLREAIEIRRVRGERHTVREAVAIVVPLCTEVAALHEQGHRFFLHPGALTTGKAGPELDLDRAATLPTHARDKACIAPECRKGEAGDACASVFSLGAIFYELVTGESVGPGMKRPREADPSLSATVEVVLGKALVGDPKHRPHDIGALAQAFHHLAPAGSMPPPAADESHLDHEDGFDVDVSLSMLPPEPATPFAPAVAATVAAAPLSAPSSRGEIPASAPSSRRAVPAAAPSTPFLVADAPRSHPGAAGANLDDPAVRLAAIKARLESDPRPRFTVIKDGMDHGPFTAVELLQQIASHSFVGAHLLRDSVTSAEKPIAEWEEFSLFAEQAGLNREIKQERRALERVVSAERHRQYWKVLIGATLLAMIGAAGAAWWVKKRAREKYEQTVRADEASNVETDEALRQKQKEAEEEAKKKGGGGAVQPGSGGGGYPQVAGGGCMDAKNKYIEDYSQRGVPPDLTAGAYNNVLANGTKMLAACGVPDTMTVSVCVAVQNGHAVGTTVTTTPSNPSIAGCVRAQVAGLSFPAHPRLDVATTTYAAVK